MKPALPVSFGAAVFCHALVLFGVGLQSGPSVASLDGEGETLGVELLGVGGAAELAQNDAPGPAHPEQVSEPAPEALDTALPVPAASVSAEVSFQPLPEPTPTAVEPLESAESTLRLLPTPRPALEKPKTAALVQDPKAASLPSHPTGEAAAKTALKTTPFHAASKSPRYKAGGKGGKASGQPEGGRGGAGGQGWDTAARPAYRHNPPPVYPPDALRSRREGVVLVGVAVSAQGLPLEVQLSRGCGCRELDEAALKAVRYWRFEPARLVGIPVPSRVEVPVAFHLRH